MVRDQPLDKVTTHAGPAPVQGGIPGTDVEQAMEVGRQACSFFLENSLKPFGNREFLATVRQCQAERPLEFVAPSTRAAPSPPFSAPEEDTDEIFEYCGLPRFVMPEDECQGSELVCEFLDRARVE